MTIWTFITFVLGFVLLVQGAEALVRGASKLASAVGLPPLAVGLTIVAYGTSAPELSVSLTSIFNDQASLAIGNAIGSNITNILLILGICAVIAPVAVLQQVIQIDIPVMILTTALLLPMGLDGQFDRLDGVILLAIALAYTISTANRSSNDPQSESDPDPPNQSYRTIVISLLQISLGTGMLVVGSHWLVKGAVAIATALGVDELVIGLTVIAVGTSLPELAASVVATLKGERDMAIGNVIGSNICNVVFVLGLPTLMTSEAVLVASEAMQINIPFALAVECFCLPIAFTGYVISRWEGFLFLFYYIAYITYLILRATDSSTLPLFVVVMLKVVIPITILVLSLSTLHAIRTKSN